MTMRTTFWYLDAPLNVTLPDVHVDTMLEGTILLPHSPALGPGGGKIDVRLMETCVLHVLGLSILETAFHSLAEALGSRSAFLWNAYDTVEGFKTAAALAARWLRGRNLKLGGVHMGGNPLAWLGAITRCCFRPPGLGVPGVDRLSPGRVVCKRPRWRLPSYRGRISPSRNHGRLGPGALGGICLQSARHRPRRAA